MRNKRPSLFNFFLFILILLFSTSLLINLIPNQDYLKLSLIYRNTQNHKTFGLLDSTSKTAISSYQKLNDCQSTDALQLKQSYQSHSVPEIPMMILTDDNHTHKLMLYKAFLYENPNMYKNLTYREIVVLCITSVQFNTISRFEPTCILWKSEQDQEPLVSRAIAIPIASNPGKLVLILQII